MRYWIIESLTRGLYTGHDFMPVSGQWGPRFKWNVKRSDPGVKRYASRALAERHLKDVQQVVPNASLHELITF